MMPAYNFQERFVQPILKGEKPHTIRARRKRATVPGDALMLYTGLRTKQARKFADAVCSKVEPVVIYPVRQEVLIDRRGSGMFVWMTSEEVNDLALRDGFDSVRDFFSFFLDTYKREKLDGFEIIWWYYESLVEVCDG